MSIRMAFPKYGQGETTREKRLKRNKREEIAKAELTRQKSEKGERETRREGGRRGRDMVAGRCR